jgi:hypothetical protein
LHDHVAREAEEIAQMVEIGFARIAGRVLALRRIRKFIAGPKDVAMRVDGTGRHRERRLRRIRMELVEIEHRHVKFSSSAV